MAAYDNIVRLERELVRLTGRASPLVLRVFAADCHRRAFEALVAKHPSLDEQASLIVDVVGRRARGVASVSEMAQAVDIAFGIVARFRRPKRPYAMVQVLEVTRAAVHAGDARGVAINTAKLAVDLMIEAGCGADLDVRLLERGWQVARLRTLLANPPEPEPLAAEGPRGQRRLPLG